MPIASRSQQRAMYAAASGRGTQGIPKAVAKEYIQATPASAYATMPAKATAKRTPVLKRKRGT
jgi:hypothetical protein